MRSCYRLMFAHDMFTSRHDVMTICLTLPYFFSRNYHYMAHNNDPMTSTQAVGIQGNPPRPSPIDSCILQIHNVLNSTLHKIAAFRKSHSALEARVISIENDTNIPDQHQGELSFVVKPFTGKEEERTNEAICTWLGRWDSHFELYPTQDSTKIAYVG